MEQRKVRVRFAPSPTGPLHIGGVRTALYNYLFAKKHNGDFILRIEDTDSNRFVPGAEEYINNSLHWCGIKFDEGVSEGGPHKPYRQSERKEIYFKYAEKLINSGFAYYAFDSPTDLDVLRKAQESQGKSFAYNFEIRTKLQTSLNPGVDFLDKIKSGAQYVIRFKTPENEEIRMHDLIRGDVVVNSSTLDDKVLFKSADGLPTYHLANIVDDYLMQISHVIRGEEWLPSLPLHVQLYKAFGWEKEMPQFAHLPLLLKPDGKGKLSKRDGDKLGFPVFPMHWEDPSTKEISSGYDDFGFLPEAFINFLALLGWNPGTTQEIFSMKELIDAFSLEKVSKSGAKFDFEKALWFNHEYLMKKSTHEIFKNYYEFLRKEDKIFYLTNGIKENISKDLYNKIYNSNGILRPKTILKLGYNYTEKVCELVRERVSLVNGIWKQSSFFFQAPESYDLEVIKKRWNGDIPKLLTELKNELQLINPFTAENCKDVIHHFVEQKQANMGSVMNCLRLCLVGGSFGPDLPIIIEMLGKDEVIIRIEKALQTIQLS